MNFKILITLILVTSCGVKSRPTPPEGTSIPKYNNYLKQQNSESSDEEKKEEDK